MKFCPDPESVSATTRWTQLEGRVKNLDRAGLDNLVSTSVTCRGGRAEAQ